MKRSIWRSKRSPSTESPRRRALLLGGTLAAGVLASCQVHQNAAKPGESVPPPADAPEAPALLTGDWRTAAFPTKVVLWSERQKARLSVAELLVPDCTPAGRSPVHLRIKLQSAFGTHLVRASLYRLDPTRAAPGVQAFDEADKAIGAAALPVDPGALPEELEAEVEGRTMRLAMTDPLYEVLKAKACMTQSGKAPGEVEADPKVAAILRESLTRIAPDCDAIEPGLAGYDCRLPAADPDAARQELAGIRTTMVRRWSRQPYLLARRLAVGMTLADAMQSANPDKALGGFCRIVRHSLPVELPATLASKSWKEAVCGESADPTRRRSAALFGLSKTVVEIDVMRQLFERTSKLGSLTLKLPDEAPHERFMVSLTPEVDVKEKLSSETARLWSPDAPKAAPPPEELPRSCWHPVYAESDYLLLLSRQLTLAGDAGPVECTTPPPPATEAAKLARYVADSITSETEFIMQNRRSTTLRLPVGTYKYTLRGLPSDASEWDDAAQAEPSSEGRIVWDDKKAPRPVIATF